VPDVQQTRGRGRETSAIRWPGLAHIGILIIAHRITWSRVFGDTACSLKRGFRRHFWEVSLTASILENFGCRTAISPATASAAEVNT
jgi:hypothetical protein